MKTAVPSNSHYGATAGMADSLNRLLLFACTSTDKKTCGIATVGLETPFRTGHNYNCSPVPGRFVQAGNRQLQICVSTGVVNAIQA
jgi:hypothetical protein